MAPPIPKTMEEMMAYYYGSGDPVLKADAPVLSTTAGVHNPIYGKKVWSQLNYEANAFAVIPKEPWDQSGWRVITALPSAVPSGGVAGETTPLTPIPDTVKPTWATISTKPKTIWHGFDVSETMDYLGKVDDSIDVLPSLREEFGKYHALAINAYLMQGVETLAGSGFESVDRMTASYAEFDAHSSTISAGEIDVYSIDRHTAPSWADGKSGHAATNRTLTLALIDSVLEACWSAGGKPKVVLTGYDTLMRWQQLLQAQRRYMDSATVIPTFRGVKGAAPGIEGGFMVATYQGIPIIPTQSAAKDGISRLYFLDTDYLAIKIAKPTQYFESDDMIAINKLGVEAGYRTMGELICKGFFASGKLRDLQ